MREPLTQRGCDTAGVESRGVEASLPCRLLVPFVQGCTDFRNSKLRHTINSECNGWDCHHTQL